MLVYLLKFSTCIIIFMVFYKLFLEHENMHHIKRYYLMASLILSLGIPFVTFIQYIEPTITETLVQPVDNFGTFTVVEGFATPPNYVPIILWSLYGFGFLIFGLKFSLNLFQIFKKIRRNPKFKSQSFVNVLLTDLITPHTFFSYIFLNKHKYEAQEIPKAVLIHEQTHSKQKHSIDVLFIELLQVVFWFNPLLFFIKKDIKLNHEFLADQAVLKNGIQPSAYQNLLLAFSSGAQNVELANAINYSSIKKRFTVMKTHTSKQKIWLRSLLFLPLVALTLYGFSEKKVEIRIVTPHTIENSKSISYKNDPIIAEDNVNTVSNIIDINSPEGINNPVETQQKATPEEVAEYNKLAKIYNSQAKDQQIIKLNDMKRLKELYGKMSKDQKASSEPFPNFPPPPPPSPDAPEVVQMHDLPPPPPIPADATPVQKQKYQKAIDNYDSQKEGYIYKHKNKEGNLVNVVVIPDNENIAPPPPPPPPISPLDHVIEMAKKGAAFYYDGKAVSSDEAIKLLKKNDQLNIQINESDSKTPKVYISKKPIRLKD